jgi:hypothetical protein
MGGTYHWRIVDAQAVHANPLCRHFPAAGGVFTHPAIRA